MSNPFMMLAALKRVGFPNDKLVNVYSVGDEVHVLTEPERLPPHESLLIHRAYKMLGVNVPDFDVWYEGTVSNIPWMNVR